LLQDTTIAFIGSGTMGEAMVKGLLENHLVNPDHVIASGPREERAEELTRTYKIRATTDNREAAKGADDVVLSVKPQVLPSVLEELQGVVSKDALVLSIVAGAKIARIRGALGTEFVVRSMPNIPAQIMQGMTVWTATPSTDERHRQQAKMILKALGDELFVKDENYLDMATALSGTGPAYAFLFMEALVDAGVHLGFSRRVSHQLVLKTMQGAVGIAAHTMKHPVELRNDVTSPGGTSAAALYELEQGGLRTVIAKAVWAAYERSKALGDAKL